MLLLVKQMLPHNSDLVDMGDTLQHLFYLFYWHHEYLLGMDILDKQILLDSSNLVHMLNLYR